MTAVTQLTVLDRDPGCTGWLRPTARLRVLKNADQEVAETALNVFVFAVASELPAVAEFVREANRRHQLRVLLVHADMDERWIGPMLARADLRTLRNLLVHRGPEVPRRVVEAWLLGAQDDLIADAVVIGDTLLVLTCSLDSIEVRFDRVAALRSLRDTDRSRFEIASDGSYLHWPAQDIHLDVEALRVATDPRAREQAQAERLRHAQGLGRAVATLRGGAGLHQDAVPGLSSRQFRRIERGEFFPRTATLEKLAAAHGMPLATYLDNLAALADLEDATRTG